MRHFQNILVGVDLAQGARSGTPELSPDNREAIRRAVWLARHNSAKLHFFSALNMSEKTLHGLTAEDRSRVFHLTRTVEDVSRTALDDLAAEARKVGVEATAQLVRGRSWMEIIRQVLRAKHDLVIVGARHLHGLRRILFGSTAMNLVRKCPCPVWVTKSGPGISPMNVLVASDLTRVTDETLRLGLSLRDLCDAKVQVLNVVEYALDLIWCTGESDALTEAYHQKVQAEGLRALQEQLERAVEGGSTKGVSLHVANWGVLPDSAILQFIKQHHIDLLLIGTIARSGIPGFLTGNTAERLLPEVPCSVLAVKPADFRSPVHLE